jgi:hypothetical protein
MIAGGGTFPSTEKVPSSGLGHALFGVIISLANPFQVDVHPTYVGFTELVPARGRCRLLT